MQTAHDNMHRMSEKQQGPALRGLVSGGAAGQPMDTAMKASRKITKAPAAGITKGITSTTVSMGSVAVATSTSAAFGAMGVGHMPGLLCLVAWFWSV